NLISRHTVIYLLLTVTLLLSFFKDTPPTEIYTLSLHDALPILGHEEPAPCGSYERSNSFTRSFAASTRCWRNGRRCSGPPTTKPDRKSTRLNSSHVSISYAVFCLKKKNYHKSLVGS